jgi:hypothetical protein
VLQHGNNISWKRIYDSAENKPDYIKCKKFNLKIILWAHAWKLLNKFWNLCCKNIKVPSCYPRDNTNEENKCYYVSEDSAARFQNK